MLKVAPSLIDVVSEPSSILGIAASSALVSGMLESVETTGSANAMDVIAARDAAMVTGVMCFAFIVFDGCNWFGQLEKFSTEPSMHYRSRCAMALPSPC